MINYKKNKKKIIGVIAFSSLLLLNIMFFKLSNVNAEEPKEGDEEIIIKECSDNNALTNKYNASLSHNADGTFQISVNPSEEEYEDNTFKVYKINGNRVADNAYSSFKKGSPINIDLSNHFKDNTSGRYPGMKTVTVTIRTTDDEDCNNSVTIDLDYYKADSVGDRYDDWDDTIPDSDIPEAIEIDCSRNYGDDQIFEKEYCEAYRKSNGFLSTNASNAFGLDATGKGKNVQSLKCKYNTDYTGTDYYRNVQYYKAKDEVEIDLNRARYTYNYDPANPTQGDLLKCKLECTETVKLEYGPPVASKAGLCFEYKVKVTSRVSCKVKVKPTPPEKTKSYCTPVPICYGVNSSGTSYETNQAGPNEEFDKCIKSCDGGKYTEKCSKKCYNQVYGKNNKNLAVNFGMSPTKMGYTRDQVKLKLAKCLEKNPNGCYYREDGGISFYTPNWSPGRWYAYSNHDFSYYFISSDIGREGGIYRARYEDGSICHDTCHWDNGNCGSKSYLNPGMSQSDYQSNKDIYIAARDKCLAGASCTTKTAEFTMKVSYTEKDTDVKKTVVFPYTPNNNNNNNNNNSNDFIPPDKDKLVSDNRNTCANTDDHNRSNVKPESTILNYNGCYKNCSARRWYQTEISFPGSWTNDKTGEVSWVDKTTNSGWRTHPDKFCIPVNAKDVNRKWWLWYMNYKNNLKATGSSSKYEDIETYKDICKDFTKIQTEYNSTKEVGVEPGDNIDYNISANVRNFGYYGWNFDISCFYALNSSMTNTSDNSTKTSTGEEISKKCDTSPTNYRVRSVSNGDLFPDPNGSNSIGTDYSKTNRKPGFNWSDLAKIPDDKLLNANSFYNKAPSDIIEDIQKTGESVYSNSHLDYEFRLTPQILNKIKKYNDTVGNYNKYCGTMENDVSNHGLSVYKSNLFNSKGISGCNGSTSQNIVTAKKIGKPGCNNDRYCG